METNYYSRECNITRGNELLLAGKNITRGKELLLAGIYLLLAGTIYYSRERNIGSIWHQRASVAYSSIRCGLLKIRGMRRSLPDSDIIYFMIRHSISPALMNEWVNLQIDMMLVMYIYIYIYIYKQTQLEEYIYVPKNETYSTTYLRTAAVKYYSLCIQRSLIYLR